MTTRYQRFEPSPPANSIVEKRAGPSASSTPSSSFWRAVVVELAEDAYRVLALEPVARMREPVRELARRREDQQALGVVVEAADREPLRGLHRRQLAEYARPALRVAVADDLAGRLVIQQHARRPGGDATRERLAVDADLVASDRCAGRHAPARRSPRRGRRRSSPPSRGANRGPASASSLCSFGASASRSIVTGRRCANGRMLRPIGVFALTKPAGGWCSSSASNCAS